MCVKNDGMWLRAIAPMTGSWRIVISPWSSMLTLGSWKSACEQPFDFQSLLWWCCVSLLLEFVCAATLMKNAWRLCVWREFSYLTAQIIISYISEGLHCWRESFEWGSTRGGVNLWAPQKMPSRVAEKEWDDVWREVWAITTVDVLQVQNPRDEFYWISDSKLALDLKAIASNHPLHDCTFISCVQFDQLPPTTATTPFDRKAGHCRYAASATIHCVSPKKILKTFLKLFALKDVWH